MKGTTRSVWDDAKGARRVVDGGMPGGWGPLRRFFEDHAEGERDDLEGMKRDVESAPKHPHSTESRQDAERTAKVEILHSHLRLVASLREDRELLEVGAR